MNSIVFVFLYLLFMLPTYCWRLMSISIAPYFVSNGNDVELVSWSMSFVSWSLLINYIFLTAIAFFKGKKINKPYIALYPVIGGFFDIILAIIPFVPTIMNIIVLIIGTSSSEVNKEILNTKTKISNKMRKHTKIVLLSILTALIIVPVAIYNVNKKNKEEFLSSCNMIDTECTCIYNYISKANISLSDYKEIKRLQPLDIMKSEKGKHLLSALLECKDNSESAIKKKAIKKNIEIYKFLHSTYKFIINKQINLVNKEYLEEQGVLSSLNYNVYANKNTLVFEFDVNEDICLKLFDNKFQEDKKVMQEMFLSGAFDEAMLYLYKLDSYMPSKYKKECYQDKLVMEVRKGTPKTKDK